MAYDFPNRIKYSFLTDISGLSTAGIGVTAEYAIRGPKGKAGRLYDWGMEGITTAVSSNASVVSVGTTADVDAYGEELSIVLTTGNSVSARNSYRPKGVLISTNSTDLGDYLIDGVIPANQKVLLTVGANSTDATGIGTAFCIIDWQD